MNNPEPIIDAAMNQQIAVERLASSIRNDIADLMTIRANGQTAHLLMAEQSSLMASMASLQLLLSHMQGKQAVAEGGAMTPTIAALNEARKERRARFEAMAVPEKPVRTPIKRVYDRKSEDIKAQLRREKQAQETYEQLLKDFAISMRALRLASPAFRCLNTVSKHYKVSIGDMRSSRRTANIVRPRQVAMYLLKKGCHLSLPDIGRRLGGRDHTTVLHAVRKIEVLIGRDPELASEIEALTVTVAI